MNGIQHFENYIKTMFKQKYVCVEIYNKYNRNSTNIICMNAYSVLCIVY